MSTPTFSVPPPAPTPGDIAECLEEMLQRKQQETPEPNFQKKDVTQSYDYLCEIECQKFTTEEVDEIRAKIPDAVYRECDARQYSKLLAEKISQNLLSNIAQKRYQTHACGGPLQWPPTLLEKAGIHLEASVGSSSLVRGSEILGTRGTSSSTAFAS
ncbi:uncharacterized protein Z520_12285 [Fonsecaea multimorphosa CBS 102226]|uniref:Uncharacterized protein n=1 Tax=Fonsecaea multimorphosa CBS 102226 TaxID=1442371 RepID=A0A0D2JNF2_9EURO|nr:uncharacterized protein Z520_12285 [Fonsecaea multimorphosa CBS 102226]KIX92014.1 hypothetical protein Z520_12285 [Fonsecaea multimorphosa CBS 102226]